MSLPRLAIRRPIGVAVVAVGILLVGLLSFRRLPVDLLPDVTYPVLVVHTSYPNAAPAEVERLVTRPIEQAAATVRGVRAIESTSQEGLSLVTVRFGWGAEMDFAALGIRERLDDLRGQLPAIASRPVLLHTDPRSEPIVALSVTGKEISDLAQLSDEVFKRRLEQVEGVARAALVGTPEREVHVEVVPRQLESLGLSLADVSRAIADANVSAPAGAIRLGASRFPLRTLGQFESTAQLVDVPVRAGGGPAGQPLAGAQVRLGEVATVRDGFRERESLTRYNGASAIGLLIYKSAGANTVEVAGRVEETIRALESEYPGVAIAVANSQATFIQNALDNVVQEVILGGLMAFLVLFFFLRNPRYPVVVALAIPISLVASFCLLDLLGVTINVLSLGGLALGVGMLMDNSIVVLENIFRHREKGAAASVAAALGAEEVQRAITASTLTTVAVFGPIIYIEGAAGQLLRALALAVGCALLVSVVVAVTLLPMLASRVVGPTERSREELPRASRGPFAAFDRVWASFASAYERALRYAMRRRWSVIGVAGLLLVVGVWVGASLERSVLPEVDQGTFRIRITLPRGSPLERTDAVAARVESVLRTDRDVVAVFTRVGRQDALESNDRGETGLHTAVIDVRLRPDASTPSVLERVRPRLSGMPAGWVLVEAGRATSLGRLLGGSDADLAVRIRGGEPAQALAYADGIRRRLEVLGQLGNVRASTDAGQPEMQVEIDRTRAAVLGVAPERIAAAVEAATRGSIATEFVAFDRRIPIVVRLPDGLREDVAALRAMRVDGVPLGELIKTSERFGPAQIQRRDQLRYVAVYADILEGGLDEAVDAVQTAVGTLPPPSGIRVDIGGENEEMQRAFRQLALAFALSLVLVYLLLAAEFESLLHPFIVLLAVPLAAVGATVALWLAGAGLNTMSLIGLVILVGIVDNDAVVKVDFINQMRREGLCREDAIFAAGRARLRPIVMNTITAMLGLTPLALGWGAGGELQAPLAVAVFGGLFSATALTLLVIPVAYDLLEEFGEWFRRAPAVV